LLDRNDVKTRILGLCHIGFLSTMKIQLSQLPKIVGSGRVDTRRALFSVRLFLIQLLKAAR
jgi:hypothetical protein